MSFGNKNLWNPVLSVMRYKPRRAREVIFSFYSLFYFCMLYTSIKKTLFNECNIYSWYATIKGTKWWNFSVHSIYFTSICPHVILYRNTWWQISILPSHVKLLFTVNCAFDEIELIIPKRWVGQLFYKNIGDSVYPIYFQPTICMP